VAKRMLRERCLRLIRRHRQLVRRQTELQRMELRQLIQKLKPQPRSQWQRLHYRQKAPLHNPTVWSIDQIEPRRVVVNPTRLPLFYSFTAEEIGYELRRKANAKRS
jgi:hypothetical protein